MTEPHRPHKLPPAPYLMQRQFAHHDLTWLDLLHPREEQIGYLRQRYAFHELHLADVISAQQRPKIDDSPALDYIFLVLHIPAYNELNRLPTASEVDCFVGNDYLITAHDGRLRPLVRLLQTAEGERGRAELMGRGPGYLLYRLMDALIANLYPLVYGIYERLDRIDFEMFKEPAPSIVQEISLVRRDVISLRRILRPNIGVVQELARCRRPFLHLDEGEYFGDLADAVAKLWDMLEEQKEIVEGLDATFSSLASHRINQEMRTFTLITVIFLPMTLFASVLGMNVIIPFGDHPLSLLFALLLMLSFSGAMIALFRRRGWL